MKHKHVNLWAGLARVTHDPSFRNNVIVRWELISQEICPVFLTFIPRRPWIFCRSLSNASVFLGEIRPKLLHEMLKFILRHSCSQASAVRPSTTTCTQN